MLASMYVCVPHSAQHLVPQGPEDSSEFLGAGVTNGSELQCRCLELDAPGSSPRATNALLSAAPSLQPSKFCLLLPGKVFG